MVKFRNHHKPKKNHCWKDLTIIRHDHIRDLPAKDLKPRTYKKKNPTTLNI